MPDQPDFSFLRESPLAEVLACLNEDQAQTRVVGGAVRNAMLGLKHGDVDLATTLLPDAVMARAEQAGFKAVPTGIDHGTVTIVADHMPIEVTTLRKDVRSHGRRADVVFGTDWQQDAERRDFTMNALYLGADGTLFDLVGGEADIAARRIRFIGDPVQRIREDYLRILRFFRFHATYGRGAPDPEVLAVMRALLEGLEHVSAERLRTELKKMLPMEGALSSLEAMQEIGLLRRLLGHDVDLSAFGWLGVLERSAPPPDPDTAWVLRLGAIAGPAAKSDDISVRLRLSNAEEDRLTHFVSAMAAPLDGAMSVDDAKAAIYRLGNNGFLDALAASWSVGAGRNLSGYAQLAALAEQWSPPKFPIGGKDLVARGIARGPQLGETLRALEEAWVRSGFALDRETLLEQAAGSER